MKKTKDQIIGDGMVLAIKHSNNTEQDSYLFCEKIEYMHDRNNKYLDHHLMFYKDRKLIFKVWLKGKEYENIELALKDIGIELLT